MEQGTHQEGPARGRGHRAPQTTRQALSLLHLSLPVLSLSHPAGAERDQHLIVPSGPAAAARDTRPADGGGQRGARRPQASSTRKPALKPGCASFRSLNL